MSRKKTEAAATASEQPQAVHQEPKILTMAPVTPAGPVSALAIQGPPSPEEVLQIAENQIKIRKGYVRLVAASLRPEDVLVFGDEVYLPAKPCQDILSWARIRVKPHWPVEEHRYPSPDGDFIEFVITATIIDTGGREVDVMGNRSTRDEFFGISGKDTVCPECGTSVKWQRLNPNDKYDSAMCPTHKKVKPEKVVHFLPLHDVDIPSVRSAAVTNLWNKSLKAIGLMPTLQDLHEAGMDIAKVKRVDFKGDGKKTSSQPPSQPKQATPPQSNQNPAPASQPKQAPQSSPSAAPVSGPPKANIPPEVTVISGSLLGIKPGTTVPKKNGQPTGEKGRPFLGLEVGPRKITCFDNKELAIDTRGNKKRAFDLILDALNEHVSFRVEKRGAYMNVVGFVRIAGMEWDEQGVPILRREPAQSTMADAFQAGEDDIPF